MSIIEQYFKTIITEGMYVEHRCNITEKHISKIQRLFPKAIVELKGEEQFRGGPYSGRYIDIHMLTRNPDTLGPERITIYIDSKKSYHDIRYQYDIAHSINVMYILAKLGCKNVELDTKISQEDLEDDWEKLTKEGILKLSASLLKMLKHNPDRKLLQIIANKFVFI